jgi:hypothetical protein
MNLTVRTLAQLHVALDGLPGHMKVEVAPGINLSAKTVDELRRLESLPSDLRMSRPSHQYPESILKIKPIED